MAGITQELLYDKEFRAKLITNPKAYIEDIDDGVQLLVKKNSKDIFYFVITRDYFDIHNDLASVSAGISASSFGSISTASSTLTSISSIVGYGEVCG